MNISTKLLLLLLPLFYFILGVYCNQIFGWYFLSSVDPEYIFFSTGITLGSGKIMLGHIDNPATPLQYLTAIVFRITYFFRNQDVPFLEDAMRNSPFYLKTLNLVLTTVVSIILYIIGKISFKLTHSLTYAILLQSTPFYSIITISILGRINPELLISIPTILLSILLLKEIFVAKSKKDHLLLSYSLVIAFGLSIKLTYIPLAFIPVIMLESWKSKFKFIGYTILIFSVFALPSMLQFNKFFEWIINLFLKTGQYGSGESTILDIDKVIPNLNKVFVHHKTMFYILIGSTVIFVANFLMKNKTEIKSINRISLALLITMLVQLLIVSKNYQPRYFIVAEHLIPIIIIVSCMVINSWSEKIRKMKITQFSAIIIILLFLSFRIDDVRKFSKHKEVQINNDMITYNFTKSLDKDAIYISNPDYSGSAFHDYSLFFAYGWAGPQKSFFSPILSKIYPNSYFYHGWNDAINYWGKKPNFDELDKKIYVYIGHFNQLEVTKRSIEKLVDKPFKLIEIFNNDKTDEHIYEMILIKNN